MPVQVTRTYLQLTSPGELRPVPDPEPAPRLHRLEACPPSLYRLLYREVGRAYHWVDRLNWSDERIREHLAQAGLSVWLLTWQAAPAGYFELKRCEDGSIEIAYFGLLPEFVGRGWGKWLLSQAAREAWRQAPNRVWLHTCTLDHPAALPNYLARGFRPVREEAYMAEVEPHD